MSVSWCESWVVFVFSQSGVGSGLAGLLATAAAHVIALSRGG
jgi:hypothetical protein